MCFNEINSNGLIYLASPGIPVPHGFTTRYGGVSTGIFKSLNLGENRGDDPDAVRENYRRLQAAFGFEKLCFTKQVHENTVRYVSSRDARRPFQPISYECDGLVTDEVGLALIIFIADCIPILLADVKRPIVAAAHAGWRGTVADIAGSAVLAMERLGSRPGDIRAAIGPGISRCCFETGPEVPAAVTDVLGHDGSGFFERSGAEGKYRVDLKAVNRALLVRRGVPPENIAVCPDCTACLPEKYWSHRVTQGRRGSQAAIIVNRSA